ncbi:MAG: hypothetical protein ACREP7_13640 [Lysobacter sp.]
MAAQQRATREGILMITKKIALIAASAFAFAFGLAITPAAIAACNPNCKAYCEIERVDCVGNGGSQCIVNYFNCLQFCNSGCPLPS